jgi:hypothetical protein
MAIPTMATLTVAIRTMAILTMAIRTMATLTMAILNTAGSSRAISTRSGTKASRSPYGTPSNPTLSNENLTPPTLTPLTPTSLLPGLGGALATAARHAALTRVVVLHALWLDGGAVLALAFPPAQLGSIGERYYSSVGPCPSPPAAPRPGGGGPSGCALLDSHRFFWCRRVRASLFSFFLSFFPPPPSLPRARQFYLLRSPVRWPWGHGWALSGGPDLRVAPRVDTGTLVSMRSRVLIFLRPSFPLPSFSGGLV